MHAHLPDGSGMDGRAGVEKAAGADLHEAIGEDMLEEPAETCQDVALGGAWARTARVTIGAGDGAVLERNDAAVGAGDLEDRGGEGGAGGVALVMGLTLHVPGERPGLRIALLQQPCVAPLFLQERTGDGRARCDGDKAGGSGGAPCRAVLREATARNAGVAVGVVLELPAPGMQDPGATREVCPETALVGGEPREGQGRRLQQGLGREALRRADQGPPGLRDGAGAEAVRPREWCVQVVLEPWLGCMLLTLGAVPVATGMMDAVVHATTWALREAGAVVATWARLDGADDLAVCEGQMGGALQGLWRTGGEDVAPGGHGRSPCMRALRRA